MQELTQSMLKEFLHYDPETGVFTWLNHREESLIGTIAGYETVYGYLVITIPGIRNSQNAHRLAWLYVNGDIPKNEIDHKNGIRGDNRFSNLRECTSRQNKWNAKIKKTNSSGYKGVDYCRGKWRARIRIFGKKVYIGVFDCPIKAGKAYESKARELHGEFYREAA